MSLFRRRPSDPQSNRRPKPFSSPSLYPVYSDSLLMSVSSLRGTRSSCWAEHSLKTLLDQKRNTWTKCVRLVVCMHMRGSSSSRRAPLVPSSDVSERSVLSQCLRSTTPSSSSSSFVLLSIMLLRNYRGEGEEGGKMSSQLELQT